MFSNPHLLEILLGLLASAMFITMNYVLSRNAMLVVSMIGIAAICTQYSIEGVWSVVAVNLVVMVRNIALFVPAVHRGRDKMWGWAFFVLLTITVLVTQGVPHTAPTILSYLAGSFNILAMAQSRVARVKIALGLSTIAWVLFDWSLGNWQNAIGDVFGVIAVSIALTRIYRERATVQIAE
jgi:hypothetical protein